ncbi:MAG: hypothetical protein U9R23_03855 [Candidatus Cloacimonadota bacterium]|nr:hypothetical protein [Candidatus Cloacimonadota bacterium]
MRYTKGLCFLTIVVILSGCATTQVARLSPNQIIWTPQTEFGRGIQQKFLNDFREIIKEVQTSTSSSSVRFTKDGIAVIYRQEEPGVYYILFYLFYNVVYNTLQTNYQKRAASTYARNLFALSKIISAHPNLFEEDKIIGFNIVFAWKATNFLEDRYKLFAAQEGINAFIPKEVLRDFAKMKISIQELSRKTIFISSIGRTELDFSDTI